MLCIDKPNKIKQLDLSYVIFSQRIANLIIRLIIALFGQSAFEVEEPNISHCHRSKELE